MANKPDENLPAPGLAERNVRSAGHVPDVSGLEDALREAEARFHQVGDNVQVVFWLYDALHDEVLYVGPMFEEVWGRSCQSLYDDPDSWLEGVHPDDRPRLIKRLRTMGTQLLETRYRIVQDDGVRWVRDRRHPIADADGRVVRVVGFVEDITERVLAAQQIRRDKAELRALASELVLTEERERQAVADGLHDDVAQCLTLARIKLQKLRPRLNRRRIHAVQDVVELLDEALRSIRSMTFELSPPVLHHLGLGAALEWLVESMQERYGLKLALLRDADPMPLDERQRILLFRCIRELLINVTRHAAATGALLSVRRVRGSVVASVEDDGVGFDAPSLLRAKSRGPGGFGLLSIRERLEHLGGSMRIRSTRGQGTRVTLTVPVASS